MTTSLKRFKKELSRVRPLLNKVNWKLASFDQEKAYVSAVFSKIAYLKIPYFEVRYHTLAKVIPCLTYQQLLTSGTIVDIAEFLQTLDFANAFVVTRRYVVAVGIITQNVIFIALRGTRPLYLSDWMIDLNITKTRVHVSSYEVKLHSGFFEAITDCIDEITTEIQRRVGNNSSIPIYVVGHSLGGALAAIAHALSQTTYSSYLRYGAQQTAIIKTHSSYAFGMPRYGDSVATGTLRSPFHTYNDRDMVPGVPIKWMGFDNVPLEYRLSNAGSVKQMAQDAQGFGWWVSRINLVTGVRHHFIERYIRRLGKAAGVY